MQSEILIIEKIFVLNTLWKDVEFMKSDRLSLFLWKNNSAFAKIMTIETSDEPEIFALLRNIEECFPFVGGIGPVQTFKSQKTSNQGNDKHMYFDFRILIQYINMNAHLQHKIAAEIGSTKEFLVEKIVAIFSRCN